MGVTTFQKKDYGVLDKHHVTPAYFYTLKFYAAVYWIGFEQCMTLPKYNFEVRILDED